MKRPWGWLARLPTLLFRVHLGWLLGERFLLLHHTGRRSGRPYSTVLEVVACADAMNSYCVAAGFGDRSDWYRNILARPRVEIEVGSRRWEAIAERLSADESEAIFRGYMRQHRVAYRWLSRVFGFRDANPGQLGMRFPIVRLRTTQPIRREALRVRTQLDMRAKARVCLTPTGCRG